ncbi:exosortase O [Leptolyngbya sp. FACHB-36]|uniref:exosortase O n=1 Tax=Leptolyngbya sp. FACHB-36 TaxID=2692808 RepID=UPI001680CD98|nr:exosortase O [Leptolyngbya sp. FACHB-36]MBD2022458.1 exosortase O [Leptolyngbya sp. FACHB-36]
MTSDNLARLDGRSTRSGKLEQLGTAALLLSWLLLNWTTLNWLIQTAQEISLFNQAMLLAGVALLVIQGVRHRQQFRVSTVPILRWGPLLLLVSSAIGTIVTRWVLILEQVPIVLALLSAYGLLGLFLDSATWRKGLPIGAAIALILPFGVQFTSGLGFPARILTAHVVEFLLKTWNVAALSSEDIIVLDTGIAQVDFPCSGLRSLWTGTLFLLTVTWLERRRFGLRWLMVFVANLGILAFANVARVLTMVLLVQVWNQPALADMLHMPLGVIAFIAACGFTLGLLRWVPRSQAAQSRGDRDDSKLISNSTFPFLLAACLLALTLVPHPPAPTVPDVTKLHWSIAAQLQTIPLTPVEQRFFATHPGVVVHKQRFDYQGSTGSILLVASPSLQVHHAPELCLIGSGFHLDHIAPQQFAAGPLTRWLSLNDKTHTAVYWFQSPNQTTGDFLTRFWQEASRQQSSWTLVSILFDQFHSADDPTLQVLVADIYRSLGQTLQKS